MWRTWPARKVWSAGLAFAFAGLGLCAIERELPARTWQLAAPDLSAQKTTATNPAWKELDCARCHEEITREWASTRHGQAWNDEVYQEELATILKKSKCMSCHVPEPLLVAGLLTSPKARETDLHFGIDCNACHLGADGAMHGPWGAATTAHASTKSEVFSKSGSNELCLSCHARSVGPVIGIGRDFDDAELAERGFSCVGCHMAQVERPIASDPDSTTLFVPRVGRSHSLQTPRDPGFLRQAFLLMARRENDQIRFELSNRAGHRIPGLNDRVLTFEVELLDKKGAVLESESLVISRSDSLDIGQSLELSFTNTKAAAVRVTGQHDAHSLTRPVQFCAETLELAE